MKELMMQYGVTLGRRYTAKEKNLFQQEVAERFGALGYPVRAQAAKGKLGRVENLIVGTPETAELVLAAAYDTPAACLLPGLRYFPLHNSRNLAEEKKDLALRVGLLAMLCAGAYGLFRLFVGLAGPVRFLALAGCVALVLAGVFVFVARGNPVNFSRNSASLALMARVAQLLGAVQGPGAPRVAFVFLDCQVASFEGMKLYAGQRQGTAPLLVLDALAAGPRLVLAHRQGPVPLAGSLLRLMEERQLAPTEKAYADDDTAQNALGAAPGALLLVSGQVQHGELAVPNTRTRRDVALDMPRLEALAEVLARLAADAANIPEAENA